MSKHIANIKSLVEVNGLCFGMPMQTCLTQLGEPDEMLPNYTEEIELLYGDYFLRFFNNRFVECTFPNTYHFVVDGVSILDIYEWLGGFDTTIDKAKFRISLLHGIAVDARNKAALSTTIFEPGRWDHLALG